MDNYYSTESLVCQDHFFSQLEKCNFQVIPSETRFWMLRTQRGYFYQEFITNEFVALAWNIIDKSTSMSKENIDRLKVELTKRYKNLGRPMTAINKCNTFINEVKPGDYLLIPSEGTREITIALAGEYYEEEKCTYENETDIISKINTHSISVKDVSCPYKKRRKIVPLVTLPSHKLHHKLHRAISNYHGISNLDDYAHYILSAAYSTYSFGNQTVITLWSGQTDPIGPRALSGLLYHSTNYFCRFVDESKLSTKVNLNSEGPVQFFIETLQTYDAELFKTFITISCIGIAGSNCEKIPDLLKGILSLPADLYERYISAAHKSKELNSQEKSAELDYEFKALEITEKKIALVEKIRASGIDPEALEGDLIGLAKYAAEMKVTPAINTGNNNIPTVDVSSDTPNTGKKTSPSP